MRVAKKRRGGATRKRGVAAPPVRATSQRSGSRSLTTRGLCREGRVSKPTRSERAMQAINGVTEVFRALAAMVRAFNALVRALGSSVLHLSGVLALTTSTIAAVLLALST